MFGIEVNIKFKRVSGVKIAQDLIKQIKSKTIDKKILNELVSVRVASEEKQPAEKQAKFICMCPEWRGQTTFTGDYFTCPYCKGEACI